MNNYKLKERAKAISATQRLDKARMERWKSWLKWTFGTLHRTSNRTTFFYLVWTPMVIFYCAIAFMGMPTAVVCPKENGLCRNLRVVAPESKAFPQVWWDKLMKGR